MSAVQADLFGEYDRAQDAAAGKAAELAAWRARFARREVPRSDAPGWVCPACDVAEWGPWQLRNNHGYNPDVVGEQPYDGWGTCHRLDLLASQARAAAKREAFEVAVSLGPTPAPWLGAMCKACTEFMWIGDLVVRDGERIVHEACAGRADAPKVRRRAT